MTEQVPASFLQAHPNATAYLDISSSAGSCKHMSGPVLSPSFLIRVPGFIGRHHAGSAQVRPPHPGSWATSNRCYMRAGLTRVCSPWLLGPRCLGWLPGEARGPSGCRSWRAKPSCGSQTATTPTTTCRSGLHAIYTHLWPETVVSECRNAADHFTCRDASMRAVHFAPIPASSYACWKGMFAGSSGCQGSNRTSGNRSILLCGRRCWSRRARRRR